MIVHLLYAAGRVTLGTPPLVLPAHKALSRRKSAQVMASDH